MTAAILNDPMTISDKLDLSKTKTPIGSVLSCKGWIQEAQLRMLHNNLDPEVAERPEDLVVYGGTGKAARDWPSFHAISRELENLADDETLLVQSGRPVGVLRTHEWAPRVLIANSNLVPDWANWPEFRRLEAAGLTMYGQMTAGSWIYIGTPLSVGVVGNAAEVLPELLRRNVDVDIVTDQTSAHDPLAYLPVGVALEDWQDYAAAKPEEFTDRARASMAAHVEAMVGFLDAGAEVFDYGNSIRGEAQLAGYQRAFDFPGFVPAYIRPLFCEGKGPFRWAALSGDPADIAATDRAILDLFPDHESFGRWIRMAQEKVQFQGLPARICWLGAGERHLAGMRFNEMVAAGELQGPVVIGRDHLDAGSVASPQRETEAMRDGSDAVADWPILNALLNTACGASWVSFHHGGGVGMGKSLHAGQVTVADGTEAAADRIRRVLLADPGLGVLRHADAGYPEALDAAERHGIRVPMAEHGTGS